jgi:hypothetical protein
LKTEAITNITGNDLFGTILPNNWNSIENKKRSYKKLPLSGYKTFEWVYYFSDFYKNVNDTEYPRTRSNEANMLVNKVYPKVFEEMKWSSSDFKKYIESNLNSPNKKTREQFYLGFIVSNDIRIMNLEKFDTELVKARKDDLFEKLTYIPHIPILSEDETNMTLFDIISKCSEINILATIYNYGILNYHRYLQLKGKEFNQATLEIANLFKNELIDKIKKNDENTFIKIVEGIAKNTTLWEPYCENATCRNARNVLDWRQIFYKIWDNKTINVTKNSWWNNSPDYSIQLIPSVKKFFSSRRNS